MTSAARQIEAKDLIPIVEQSLSSTGQAAVKTIAEQWLEEGRVEGREEGRVLALQNGIHDILEIRFPEHASELALRITAITSADALQRLHRLSLTAGAPSEIERWLSDQH